MAFIDELLSIQESIPSVLSKEEYFSQVIFSSNLLMLYYSPNDEDMIYFWYINEREGYIQQGRFRDEKNNLQWAIIYRSDTNKDNLSMNLGDLLGYVPYNERLKWKKYFLSVDPEFKNADKTIFPNPDSPEESQFFIDYWKRRIQEEDETGKMPWLSQVESEKVYEEFHYLQSIEPNTGRWRDLEWMDFKPQVLDKYKNNALIDVGSDHVNFLRKDGNFVCGAHFHLRSGKLMMRSEEFTGIPPRERGHWMQFHIPKENEDLK